jgi:nicotinamide phosphoribosyltransferase
MVAVVFENDEFRLIDNLNPKTIAELESRNLLQTCYLDGEFTHTTRFEEIRNRLKTETIRVYGK